MLWHDMGEQANLLSFYLLQFFMNMVCCWIAKWLVGMLVS